MKYELYGGDITLDFNDKKHVYTVDGKIIPSVTGITGVIDKSGPLMWWAVGRCIDFVQKQKGLNSPLHELDEVESEEFWHDAHRAHLRTSREATNIGKLAHEWIELHLKGKNPAMPKNKKLKATVDSFIAWSKSVDLEPIDTEFKVYSWENGYAGTCDFDGYINGERCIADWKTGKAVYPEHDLQTMAYQYAREEELSVAYEARWVVILPKDGGEVITKRFDAETYEHSVRGFLGALNLWRFLKEKA